MFRGLQGVGAGCLIPVAQTITADLYTMEQRAKMSAVFSGMFGFASIIGPFLGGFITDNFGWRWVFYVNLPIGIAAIALVAVAMIEPLEHKHKHRLDYLGIVTLLAWTILLVFALEMGGREYAWGSPEIVGALRGERAVSRRVRDGRAQGRGAAHPVRPVLGEGAARVDDRRASSSAWRCSACCRSCRCSCRS